jgi:glycerol-3-phosphate dehydrogenase
MRAEQYPQFDVLIVGAGVIGAAVARELSKYDLAIGVLERNSEVAQETSAGNSGVVHGGFDPTPGTLQARLNVLGKQLYQDEWFQELDFSYQKVDSLVLAYSELEESELKKLYDQGIINGLNATEMQILNREQCLALEPNLNPEITAGLLCSSSFIVDPVRLTMKLVQNAIINGTKLFLQRRVAAITKQNDLFLVECITQHGRTEKYRSRFVVNAAGHYADVIAHMIQDNDFTLKARRGQYRVIEKTERSVIGDHILFMVPTIYGKGVIVAPMLDGHLLVGPTAEENIAKEDTRLITMEQFEQIGIIARRIIPGLRIEKTCAVFSGSRSICVETDDFWIAASSKDQRFINVAGISSPGLSAAPAIAQEVIALIKAQTALMPKPKTRATAVGRSSR